MSVLSLSTSTAVIQRQSVAPDASGGAVRTWATRLSGIPCRISSVSAREQAEFDRADTVVDAKIYFSQDVSLLKEDRIVVGLNYYFVVAYNGTRSPSDTLMVFSAFVRTRNQTVNP
jgi:hypothetical protein